MASSPVREMETALIDMIDRWAVNSPDTVAAEWKDTSLSFAQLRRASIRVASMLHKAGLGPRSRVPILTKMSLEMLPAVVGVLRLGACYAPIDVDSWSRGRIEAALEATEAKTVLATTAINLPGYNVLSIGSDILESPDVSPSLEAYPYLISARQGLKPTDLVYIIFTSGTTGQPKGVMIPQSCVVNLITQDYDGILVIRPGKKVLLLFSIAFDGCAGVIFNSMCNGGTIIMASSDDYAEKAAKCEAIIITPTILSTMDSPAHYPGSRPTCKVYNCYGPTECTTAISSIELRPDTPIFIGGIIPGIEIVLLDENLEEAEVGEICIRGPCLAAGYLNNEELTLKKFIIWKGQRHYRTGDLAKRIPEGFKFIGRIDLQVKNRGFLINLDAEVVPALLSYPGVRSAAAIMHASRLIGFVTPSVIPPQLLRKALAKEYDSFIVPDVVLPLEKLPVTSNQKIDTAALKAILIQETTTHKGLTEQSSPSEVVKYGFSKVLGTPISQINDDSSFWELGGNSLSAVRLSSFLRMHHLSIPTGDFFVLDKVSSICQKAVPTQAPEKAFETVETRGGVDAAFGRLLPITDIQYQYISETLQSPAKNNLVFSMKIDNTSGKLSSSVLHKAWEVLFKRHSILRTAFDLDKKTQLVQPEPNLEWTETQVSESEFDSTCETIRESVWDRICEPSPISWKPLNYLRIIEAPKKSIGIFWVIHHSLLDGWSVGIILDELEAITQNRELPEPPQFSDAVLFQECLKIQRCSENDSFWKKSFAVAHALKPINLPKPANLPSLESSRDWIIEESVIAISKSELDNFAHSQRVSSSSLFHAALSLVLSKYTDSKTVCYMSSFSGRNLALASTESIVGPLNQRCPTITTIDETMALGQYLRAIHREVYELREFQWSSYGVLERILGHEVHELLLIFGMIIFLDMPVDYGRWKLHDEQEPVKPLELYINQDGETINAQLRYNYTRFDAEAVRQFVAYFGGILAKILNLPANSLVESVTASIA
ncbi:NRPS cluster protein [Microsporum canis]